MDSVLVRYLRLRNLPNLSSSSSSSSIVPEVGDDAFVEGEKNSTTHTLSDAGDTARASLADDDAILLHCGISLPHSPSHTETDPSESSSATITLTRLPPKHRQGRHPPRIPTVWRGHAHFRRTGRKMRRRHFADVHGVKCTLHAHAEKPLRLPLRVRGKFIVTMNYSC